jgi:ribosome-associated protein
MPKAPIASSMADDDTDDDLDDISGFNLPDPSVPGPRSTIPSAQLLQQVQACLADNKAEDVVVVDLQGKSTIADYMVVVTGTSSRQVVSMGQKLAEQFKPVIDGHIRTEGMAVGDWVLVDLGDVIVHLFRPEVREFYSIEKMWTLGAVSVSADKPERIKMPKGA